MHFNIILSALSIQRLYWLLSHMLHSSLRGLLSVGDNMLELKGVSSSGHLSLILISLNLSFYHRMCESVYLPLLSTVSSLLRLLSSSPSLIVQLLWQGQCPFLPWPERTLIRHSLCCSLSSSRRRSSSSSVPFSRLLTVAVPLAPVSRGRQSAIGPPLKWWATEITG